MHKHYIWDEEQICLTCSYYYNLFLYHTRPTVTTSIISFATFWGIITWMMFILFTLQCILNIACIRLGSSIRVRLNIQIIAAYQITTTWFSQVLTIGREPFFKRSSILRTHVLHLIFYNCRLAGSEQYADYKSWLRHHH